MPDRCPFCMQPLPGDELAITEPPLTYAEVALELELDPLGNADAVRP